MGLNLYAYPTFNSGFLIADPTAGTNANPGNSADALGTWTLQTASNGTQYPIAAAIEVQSILGALVVPRMTTAQKTAIGTGITVANANGTIPCNGSIIYDTDLNEFQFMQAGAWESVQLGEGFVTFEGATPTTTELARFGDNTGTVLEAGSGILVSNAGALTGVGSIAVAIGGASAPTYTFTGNTNTGIYSSGSNTIDFTTGGARAFSIGNVATMVNYWSFFGSSTGNDLLAEALGTDTNINFQLRPKGTGQVIFPVGATATPSITFNGRTDTGMWSSNGATIDFSTTGGHQLQISNTGTAVNQLQLTGSATGTAVGINSIGSDANVSIQLAPKGTGTVLIPAGALANLGLGFTGDATTGIFSSGSHAIDFANNGVEGLQIEYVASGVNYLAIGAGVAAVGGQAAFPIITPKGSDTLVDVAISSKGAATGLALMANSAAGAGLIKFFNGTNAHYTAFQGGASTANVTFTLPIADATANSSGSGTQVPLSTNTSGTLSFSELGNCYTTITLNTAAMTTLYSAPTKLIDAPGANLGIVVHRVAANYVYNTTAFTVGATTGITFQYGNTVHGAGTLAATTISPTGFVDQTHNTAITTPGALAAAASSALVNTALYASATGADLTGGGTSDVVVSIWYSVVAMS